jgi:3-oxoacyl-[acyl-carrier-protein] synthase-3
MTPLRILSTGIAAPTLEVTSDALDERLGRGAGYTARKSGVVTRRFAGSDDSQSELAAAALKEALKNAGVGAASVNLLISACGVQEQALPSTACAISAHAGLAQGMPAFDINASCLGFVVALNVAGALLRTGAYQRIAVVSADLPSRGIDWTEPESSLIFGDGAAAAILEGGAEDKGIRSVLYCTFSHGRHLCEIRAGGTACTPARGAVEKDYLFRMNGKQVLKMALREMPGFVKSLLGQAGIRIDSVDAVIPHQASHLGMAHVIRRLDLDPACIVDIYQTHGNQVAASIPTALHAALSSGRLMAGQRAMLLGTAAGISLGGMILDL